MRSRDFGYVVPGSNGVPREVAIGSMLALGVRTVGPSGSSRQQARLGGGLRKNVPAFLARGSVVSAERRGLYSPPPCGR